MIYRAGLSWMLPGLLAKVKIELEITLEFRFVLVIVFVSRAQMGFKVDFRSERVGELSLPALTLLA